MKSCKRGHEYRGDENYRARHGCCPVCFQEVQRRYQLSQKGRDTERRYSQTERGRARHLAYNRSEKGEDRAARYRQSPKGWLAKLASRREKALWRRTQRKEAEDS